VKKSQQLIKEYIVVQAKYKGKRKSVQTTSLKVARELEAKLKTELLREVKLGIKNDEIIPTLEEFYYKTYSKRMKGQLKGWRVVDVYFKNWILPQLGRLRITEISVEKVEQLKQEILEKEGKSARTAQHVIALLRACLNKARKWGIPLEINPASQVEVPKFDNKRTRFLSYEEAALLLKECKKRNTKRNLIYPLVLLALTTGMRAGEIFRLKVQDLDFTQGIIHIRDTKAGFDRVAYMTEEVKKELLNLIEGKAKEAYVFSTPEGRPFNAVPDVWKSIIKKTWF